MNMKFNTDGNISLNNFIYFPTKTIIIRSITQKYGKYYQQKNVCVKYKTVRI